MFWLIQLSELSIVDLAEGRATTLKLLEPRALVLGAGIVFSLPIIAVAAHWRGISFWRRLVATLAVGLIMCAALVAVNYGVFFITFDRGRPPFDLIQFIYTAIGWSWFFLGITGAVIGVAYSVEVRERERRLAAMSEIAKDARLAALRYQLNPHFLFNTLNSIAALVEENDKAAASTMVLSLSEFLRATLELDPLRDVPLCREVELQSLYLSIEKARFPARLTTRFAIADDVRCVPVPALITQPIIENAIRHAVARTQQPVMLTIEGEKVGKRLRLSITDNGACNSPASGGTGVGMSNVRARLEGRFGQSHSFTAGPIEGGYRVMLEIPLESVNAPA
jgi:hypothetical protein